MTRSTVLILTAALLLSGAAPAQAGIRPPPLSTPAPAISYDMSPVPDVSGYYDDTTNTIHVYRGADRFTLEHERGHAYDALMLDDGERNRFQRLYFGSLDLYWSYYEEAGPGLMVSNTSSPQELFADAYAAVRLRRLDVYGLWETGYGYYPMPRQHRRIAKFIERAGRDLGSPTQQVAP